MTQPTPADEAVASLAVLLGLPIEPAWRPAVTEHLARTLAAAALFADFPLPDGIEAAPVFVP